MNVSDEEWVKAAMSDDEMVVDLLVRLHHAPPPPLLLRRAVLPLKWSVRQRRSKSASAKNDPKRLAHSGSPTTPLSWSGVTSFSAGSEESTPPSIPLQHSNTTRSKVNIDSEKSNSKRSSKKKTLAELREEENSLLKERRDLRKEMAALRLYLDRQRATNGNLKRIKTELRPCLGKKNRPTSVAEESISGQLQRESVTSPLITTITLSVVADNGTTLRPPEEKTYSKLILPDLNMPFEL